MNIEQLGSELKRLGCNVRNCGGHGFIFMPKHSGGIKLDGGNIHFWDCGINVELEAHVAFERLNALPDGSGYQQIWSSLQEAAA